MKPSFLVKASRLSWRRFLLDLKLGPNRKRIVSPRFELVIPFFQKPTQGFLNQRSTLRGLDNQAILAEAPPELPCKVSRDRLPFQETLWYGAIGNPNLGYGFRQSVSTHPETAS